MALKCLIVEDEKLAQDVLIKYISLIPSLQLVHCSSSGSDAISYLHTNNIDLIFLDINMPELSGIEFLKTLLNPPHVIITTAYSEYALEGYEYSVCDYLLKPIRYERFIKAINKVIDLDKQSTIPSLNQSLTPTIDYLFIKEDNLVQKIFFKDLLYVQAFGNYLKIFFKENKTIVTRSTLTDIESQLPGNLFLRVHKSFIVAINSIDKISYNQIHIKETAIPIGTTYKQEVLKKIKIK